MTFGGLQGISQAVGGGHPWGCRQQGASPAGWGFRKNRGFFALGSPITAARRGAAARAGCGASRSPAVPAGPDPCSSPASRARARPGICVLPRTRGVRGAAPSSAWLPAPVPDTGPAGPRFRVRPPALRIAPAPGPGGAGPRARPARTHLCLPSLPGARSSRESFSGPGVPGGGEAEAAGAGARARQPQAGAGCAPQPRRVRPAEAALRAVRCVRGAPAAIREAIQLPGLISSRGVRLGAGSQRARPRGRSRRRRGGDGGVPGQPSALASFLETEAPQHLKMVLMAKLLE
ncbi:uncharacterized protein [Chlorocebus sabaeus]|uniref:uncharacterized protein n=1 Tax=Chlorocebus sabaeus TaxID=60711 RepID=UPI003BFA2BBC